MKARHEFDSETDYLIYLRDYIALEWLKLNADIEGISHRELIEQSYEIADLMMQERSKKPAGW